MPGRKTVVFLSEGFYLEDSRGLFQAIAAQAARGGTTIYSIDGRGLIGAPSPNRGRLTQRPWPLDDVRYGRRWPEHPHRGHRRLHRAQRRRHVRAFGLIVRDTSTYYVIGYQPDNNDMDGKYRKIEVKTKVAGLNVRARKGYAALALPPQETIRRGEIEFVKVQGSKPV